LLPYIIYKEEVNLLDVGQDRAQISVEDFEQQNWHYLHDILTEFFGKKTGYYSSQDTYEGDHANLDNEFSSSELIEKLGEEFFFFGLKPPRMRLPHHQPSLFNLSVFSHLVPITMIF
jgi:hypothetical protein